jgi:hypothetical protein
MEASVAEFPFERLTLQVVGDPYNSAPWLAANVPRANPNGMF